MGVDLQTYQIIVSSYHRIICIIVSSYPRLLCCAIRIIVSYAVPSYAIRYSYPKTFLTHRNSLKSFLTHRNSSEGGQLEALATNCEKKAEAERGTERETERLSER